MSRTIAGERISGPSGAMEGKMENIREVLGDECEIEGCIYESVEGSRRCSYHLGPGQEPQRATVDGSHNVSSVESTAWAAWQVMGTFFGINGPVRILNWFYDVAQGKLRTAEELFPITPEEIKRFAIGRIITPEELSDAVISSLIQHGLVAAIDRASAQHLGEEEIRKEITNS